MSTALIDHDLLTETARELAESAAQLNPVAAPDELLMLSMAALGALAPGAPDAWLAMAVERAAEQLGW